MSLPGASGLGKLTSINKFHHPDQLFNVLLLHETMPFWYQWQLPPLLHRKLHQGKQICQQICSVSALFELYLHRIFLPENTLHKRKKTPLYVSIERPCHCPLDWLVVDYEHHSGMLTSANLGKEGESTFFVPFSWNVFFISTPDQSILIHIRKSSRLKAFSFWPTAFLTTCYLNWRSADLKGAISHSLYTKKANTQSQSGQNPSPGNVNNFNNICPKIGRD